MWNHESGLRGVWDVTYAPDMLTPSHYYSNDERFEVQGSKGFVRVNRCTARVLQEPAVEVYADGECRTYHALDDDWGSSFRDSTRQFIRWLRGDPTGELLWSADEALEVMRFLTAARESSRLNRPVTLSEM
jgi:predicted dehydrogenase